MSIPPKVLVDMTAGVATLTLAAPEKRNALSRQLSSELHDALVDAGANQSVRAVVLTHTGPIFCAGADLKERSAGVFPEVGPGALIRAIASCPKPVVARLTGSARAGGVGLAAACDLSVIDSRTTFAFTEVRLGLVPATIAAVVVPRLGHSRAAELFLTGREFSASEAISWGLFTSSREGPAVDDQLRGWLHGFGGTEPEATGATKALVRRLSTFADDTDIERLEAESAEWFASPGGTEGMLAFAQKRSAAWVCDLGADWESPAAD